MPGDELWQGIGLAVLPQTGIGVPADTSVWEDGTITDADGGVLGDRDSGDANSGITIPAYNRIASAVADVGFTKQFDTFLRAEVANLAITVQLKGNGATATPATDEAKPAPGIDTLLQMAGFSGASGTAPQYIYTPGSGGTYGTVGLFVDDLRIYMEDCIVGSLDFASTPGGLTLATFNIEVGGIGQYEVLPGGFDGLDFLPGSPQASVSAPVVRSANNQWSTERGFNTLTINVANTTEQIEDSNRANGFRAEQTERQINASGIIYVDSVAPTYELDNLTATTAPTDDMTFTIGTPATAGNDINAYSFALNNLLLSSYTSTQLGTAYGVSFEGNCTATTAGGEFSLTFE